MFGALLDELEKWSDTGKVAEFWWRDDDAQKSTKQLEQLLVISDRHRAAVSLATIPHGVQVSLAEVLSGRDQVSILQHGFSHRNYAPPTERKMELGWHRDDEQILGQIQVGLGELEGLFGEQLVPVMVPPWNRIDSRVVEKLESTGLRGLSTLGPRKQQFAAQGLKQVNVHVDIINWKQGRCFAGENNCIEQIIAHLSAKRAGLADPGEPTGIMSHHLVHDAGCWAFLDELFGFLRNRSSTSLISAGKIF
ncbi:MAG: hypothetical protein GY726_12810 [Proteobacteria bacterium]|nr:hypothetical protein [Pseudomonadota bacterium]